MEASGAGDVPAADRDRDLVAAYARLMDSTPNDSITGRDATTRALIRHVEVFVEACETTAHEHRLPVEVGVEVLPRDQLAH
jgi:hypothetical protein